MTTATDHVDLDIQGMSCASCAARIEKRLNKLDGVNATVNYATEKAAVDFARPVAVDDLLKAVDQAGYGATVPGDDDEPPTADPAADLRRRLIVAATLTVPVVAMSMVPPLQFPGWQWVCLVLATPVVFWAGWRFHRAALINARHLATSMDTLISLGALAAYLWSLYAMVFGHAGMIGMRHEFQWVLERGNATQNIYLEAATVLVTFQLLGRWLEARAKYAAGSAVRALLHAGAKDVTVLRREADGSATEVRRPIGALKVDDEFVVRPGEKIATDGVIVDGHGAVDNSLVTGESVPIEIGPGDEVVGATINTNGRLVVRATRVGNETQLAQIATLVEQAQTGKAKAQRLADKISAVFVPVVMVLAVITLGIWLLIGASASTAISAGVAVLIIACPCALGLATPTALLVGTGRGAELGIVIKGPEALERSGDIDTVLLDKTGTLTSGRMAVASVTALGEREGIVLSAAGAVEAGSEHPIAQAIVARATQHQGDVGRNATLPRATEFVNHAGGGVSATVDGRQIHIGSPAFVGTLAQAVPGYDEALAALAGRAETPVVVAWDGRVRGVLGVADTIKPSSAEAVAALRSLGLRPVLLTGDAEGPAHQIATEVGIDDVIARVLPADKAAAVERIHAEGSHVAMVGDGVNDAAALASADLGIAMGTGTDVAIQASDLTLMRGDLAQAPTAIRLARATLRTIHGNLFWAFAYNVVAIPVAALGFLNPMLAGIAMACSSLFVVTNSLRLRRFR